MRALDVGLQATRLVPAKKTPMTEWLLYVDRIVFNTANGSLGSTPLGRAFVLVTHLGDWAAVWLILCVFLLVRNRANRETQRVVVLCLAALVVSEILAALLKGIVARPRPSEALVGVRLVAGRAGGFSFPSAHATRSFAAAVVVWSFLRGERWAVLALAGLIAVSRVVVGLHYPSDIIAGAVLGALVGALVLVAGNRWLGSAATGPP